MGETADQLRQEIEETRQDISRDVDALAYKASPKRAARDRVTKAKSTVTNIKDKVMGSAQHDSGSTGSATGTSGTYDEYAAYSAATGGTGSTYTSESESSGGPSIGERASGAAGSVKGKAGDVTGTVKEKAGDVTSTVKSTATQAPAQLKAQAEGNPLAAGLIAFGVGWLASSLVPATRAETQAARRAGDAVQESGIADKAKEAAKGLGQQVKEDLQPKAQEAVEAVKSKAQEGAQTVKEEGASAARDVKDDAKSQVSSGGQAETGTPVYDQTVDVTSGDTRTSSGQSTNQI